MDGLVFLLVLVVGGLVVVALVKSSQRRTAERHQAALEPVKRLAFEDVTALGEELRGLDADMAGRELDAGERADYQRALDAYESAKSASEAIRQPDDIRNVTEILEDGRYAMACVRSRVAGEPLPTRRPPCFFDPRHGMSVADVPWTPPGGTQREVPACGLDAERVRAGAEPDTRMVMAGSRRVPYWQGGPAYQPYARGYFGTFGPMDWIFMGFMFDGLGDGLGMLGDGLGDVFGGIGDMFAGFDF